MMVWNMMTLAQNMSRDQSPNSLVLQLAGGEIARQMLTQMELFDFVPFDFKTKDLVVERLSALETQRAAILELSQKAGRIYPTMTDSEIKQFVRRQSVDGEIKAMQWLVQQRPQHE